MRPAKRGPLAPLASRPFRRQTDAAETHSSAMLITV
jgi:hypothetical protein